MRPEISSAALLRVLRSVWIASHIGGEYGPPDEKCGILLGRGNRVTRIDHTANVAGDPFTTFEIDPAALIAAYRNARRKNGLEVLGFFHTHPHGPPTPSERDAEMAPADGKLWLIAAREGALLWRAVDAGEMYGRFDPVRFDLRIGKRVELDQAGVRLR
jgi:proteasome lid subunit RPN8/RPN11